MDKTITAIFNGFAQMQAGKLMTAAGIIMLVMSGFTSIGDFTFNEAMAEDMQFAGLFTMLLGAYFSWYRAKQEAEDRRTQELVALHERIGAIEEKVRYYHGDAADRD